MKQDNVETEHVERHREEKLLREMLKLSIFLMRHLKKNDWTDLDSKMVTAQAARGVVNSICPSKVCALLEYVANSLPNKYIGHAKQFYFVQRMCVGCMFSITN